MMPGGAGLRPAPDRWKGQFSGTIDILAPFSYDRTEVRAWAKANRVKVSPRGRIANDVVEKWRKATSK
jgi:hypothetical protein